MKECPIKFIVVFIFSLLMVKKKVWIDIKNSHEPLLFKSLMEDLPYDYYITARDYAEVTALLNKYEINYKKVGRYHAKNKVTKAIYLGWRSSYLAFTVPKFDFFLSHGSLYGILASKIRFRPAITIFDGDIHSPILKKIFKYSDYLVLTAFTNYKKFGISDDKVRVFHGFKEDIYIADLKPENCPKEIPYDPEDYVIIRPEAYGAYYVPTNKSIVPELINRFSRENINIVLLPRYPEERMKYSKFDNVYIPSQPINGICGAYFARAVLTGSGTLGREAACIGTIAVSFFPGKELLSVDKEMIRRGWLFHSREPKEIVNYVIETHPREKSLKRSVAVKEEVVELIKNIIEG